MTKKGKREIDPKGASRRNFLGKAGGMTAAVAAATAGLPSLLSAKENTRVEVLLQKARHRGVIRTRKSFASMGNAVGGPARRIQAFRVRLLAALRNLRIVPPPQVPNTDEVLYASNNYIGNYSKGLPHDANGLVTASNYQTLLTAGTTGKPSDWAKVPLGGTVPLVSPQAGLAFNLEGSDNADLSLPPAPALASAQRSGEMVENYWMALLRDVAFSDYSTNATAALAITDLNKLGSDFQGPTPVTAQNLFRGTTVGDSVGPYMSQFLMMNVAGLGTLSPDADDVPEVMPLPSQPPNQLYTLYAPGVDYMNTSASWLAVQNGQATNPAGARGVFFSFGPNQFDDPGYLFNGRAVSSLVHVDELYQHYFWAAAELLAGGFPPNPGNPYGASTTPNQTAFATWGGPHFTGLMAEAAYRGALAVWYQKWYVHRALRPEAYAGLVQLAVNGPAGTIPSGVIQSDVLNSMALTQVMSANQVATGTASAYLPMAYPEGCPWHPSYAEGHGTVAGSAVTMLKALFDESTSFISMGINPVYSPDGVNLPNYAGSPIDQGDVDSITVGTELNKLASNIALARAVAGVHWRSDYINSLLLGEAVAIGILQDIVNTFNEDGFFQFTSFLGNPVLIKKT